MGDKEKNKHGSKKLRSGRGTVGKVAVVGMKDRDTNRVSAEAVEGRRRADPEKEFVLDQVVDGAKVYTDEHKVSGAPEHPDGQSLGRQVRGRPSAHTNGIESFWSMLKRVYHGTYHKMSRKHLGAMSTSSRGGTTPVPRIPWTRWRPSHAA